MAALLRYDISIWITPFYITYLIGGMYPFWNGCMCSSYFWFKFIWWWSAFILELKHTFHYGDLGFETLKVSQQCWYLNYYFNHQVLARKYKIRVIVLYKLFTLLLWFRAYWLSLLLRVIFWHASQFWIWNFINPLNPDLPYLIFIAL